MPRGLLLLLLAAVTATSGIACRGEAVAAQAVAGAPTAAGRAAAARPSEPQEFMESCDDLPLADKEACYARQPEELIAECERVRLHHCAPYARVHVLEERLRTLNAELLRSAASTAGSDRIGQPGEDNELAQSLSLSDRTWRAYRDAQCSLDPMIQGMSLREAPDLAEACRADMTSVRIREVEGMLSTVMEDTIDEQQTQ